MAKLYYQKRDEKAVWRKKRWWSVTLKWRIAFLVSFLLNMGLLGYITLFRQ